MKGQEGGIRRGRGRRVTHKLPVRGLTQLLEAPLTLSGDNNRCFLLCWRKERPQMSQARNYACQTDVTAFAFSWVRGENVFINCRDYE